MTKEEAIKAVRDEPELPGSMPEEMYRTIQGLDKQGLENWCRILVRATKEGIIERLEVMPS